MRRAIYPLAAVALVMPVVPAMATDCAAVAERARIADNDIAALQRLHADAAACDAALADWVGRRIAEAQYNAAVAVEPVDEGRLLASLNYGRTWQALATLGDLAASRRDYALAARRYQEALVEIADATATPRPPVSETILAIRRQAEEAALLSPSYVPSARGRNGDNVGLTAMSIRGVAVAAVALPVQFKFDSTDFTDAGIAAVQDLAAILKADQVKLTRVTLVGHTDATGDADYNQQLSVRRAQAVRDYLAGNGIAMAIVAEGRGESEPYRPDDPGRYNQTERDQLSRRVELRRE